MAREYRYKAICHTKCFWLDTLWEVGEEYYGDIPPNKHFSADGTTDKPAPPKQPADDPRSNAELKAILDGYGISYTKREARKKLWAKVNEIETAAEKDAATSTMPVGPVVAPCGFKAKNETGMAAHRRQCPECKAIDAHEAAEE